MILIYDIKKGGHNMKLILIKVANCKDHCPYRQWDSFTMEYVCRETEKIIFNDDMVDGFPTFCPLPDVEPEVNSAYVPGIDDDLI